MRLTLLFLCLCLLAVPALAQLDYQQNAPKAPAPQAETREDLAVTIKKTRANEQTLRPDWYGLFVLWAKQNPGITLAGLKDPKSFDNFASFMACDWVRDYRANDVVWPEKQIGVVQKFNQRVLNPQTRYRLLTYAVLGPYVPDQQQFVFRPLDGADFSIKFSRSILYGIEDDCEGNATVSPPWPNEFIVGFKNSDFITALPMEKIKAEYFLNNLPKDDKGVIDRRLVVEVEFDIVNFEKPKEVIGPGSKIPVPPVQTELVARRAIVYADSNRTKELGRFGFPQR